MTKRLEEILNLDDSHKVEEKTELKPEPTMEVKTEVVDLKSQLDEFDKISSALPKVEGLGYMSEVELDNLATKAERAFDDLMDLGMNVQSQYAARMFEVAGNILKTSVEAKSNKINMKLKMIELQLKKLGIDNKTTEKDETVEGNGFIITDRNSLLQKLRDSNK